MLPKCSQEPRESLPRGPKTPPRVLLGYLGLSWGTLRLLKNYQNSQKSIKNSRNVSSLGFLGCSWILLDALLALLGVLRPLLGPHGRSLAALGALLGYSWAALGPLVGDLWQSLALSARSRRDPSKHSEQPNRTNTQLGSGGFASAFSININTALFKQNHAAKDLGLA